MKKFFTLLFGILLFVSCSSDDSGSVINQNNEDLKDHLHRMEKTYADLQNNSQTNKKEVLFMTFKKHHNVHFENINEKHHELVGDMLYSKDYNTIFNTMHNEKLINTTELKLLNDFTDEAIKTSNIQNVVNKYKAIFIKENLYTKYESFFIGFNNLNELHPHLFIPISNNSYGYSTRGFFSSCAGASVGLALGFAGLVAGGASVVGAGIGAAGFIYASMQWGEACR